ncbi:MAG TPA: adenylate/guanylate cyclase domain-containing protein [Stenomitos sp.]
MFQALLAPETPLDVELELPEGTYRLRSPQAPTSMTVTLHADGPDAGARQRVRVGPDGFEPAALELPCTTLRLRLEAADSFQVTLERLAWAENIVTGAYVSTMQEFRDLFSSEVLSADLELGISRLAIMFTDLKSSTAMYEQLGDATAFRLVQTHFRILQEAIAANRGAIVKTVGDAVMASFYDVADGVRAAFEIQASIDRYNAEHPEAPAPIIVKLGVHVGPCIAVTLNERLDYFGTTVNMAARVQNEATGGDIVLSEEVLADPGVRHLLAGVPVTEQRAFQVQLKGLAAAYELTRLVPDVAALASGKLRRFTGAL